ncbi:peptidyl-prolyl cis-trans isomerase [Aureococcus anophagefferens]|nr:peptidyl-prolyl cis-trans isomerase [Aureococcus anophagefferens]
MRADEEDPNGPEAGTRFLAENRKKKDVIACSSGLQYRVIKEGDGLVIKGWTEAMTLMATAGVRETADPAVP